MLNKLLIILLVIMASTELEERIYPVVYAAQIKDEEAIRAVIGEDSSSYLGMYAVACAIRNRGSLNGVYGLKAVKMVGKRLIRVNPANGRTIELINQNTYSLASRAWAMSLKGPDVVNGAKSWEGAKLSRPYWEGDFKHSVIVGENRFYYN